MEPQEILERLKSLIHERFGIDPAGISGSTTQAELGIDSLLMVDMMLDVETELGITFESMDLPRNPDMDTIVDLVRRNLAASGGGTGG
jgi:acyl carrier protein